MKVFISGIHCIECMREFGAGGAFSFAGNLACEQCVRELYTCQGCSPETIADELPIQ